MEYHICVFQYTLLSQTFYRFNKMPLSCDMLRTSRFVRLGAQWDGTQLLGLYLYWHKFKFSIVPIDKFNPNHSFQPTGIY